MDVEQLRTLVAVADTGTFDRAAAALHITPSAVSQRIKALESAAGTVLLQRSKPVRPTARGTALLRNARQLVHLADETAAQLRAGDDGRGPGTDSRPGPGGVRAVRRIPVVVNADSIATWFGAALVEVGRAGVVELEVRRDDEHVTAELLRSGEVMAAVTTEPAPVQGCSVRPLGTMTYRARASRRFVRRWFPGADGVGAAALAAAPLVQFDGKDRMQSGLLARLAPGATPRQTFVPDSTQFVEAVRAGVGWGMVPDQQDPRGDLVVLDQAWVTQVHLHWQVWKLVSPGLDHVTDAVVRAAAPLR